MTTVDRRRFLTGSAGLGAAGLALGLGACSSDGSDGGSSDGGSDGAAASSVPSEAVDRLRAELDGTALVPGDDGYTAASDARNARFDDIRPAVIAQCANEADVAAAIRWSTEEEIPPVPKGGGHSYAGFSQTEGLLVDIAALNQVDIDADAGTMTLGGAASNMNVLNAAAEGPVFLPGGTCLQVAYGGLTLGGGIGYNAHWAGLASDHLRSTRVVLASGEVVVASPDSEPDLFWACQGGAGGNFGINTELTFEPSTVPTDDISWYKLTWRGADDAAAVMAAYDLLIQTAPNALNCVAMAAAKDPADGGPRGAIDVMSRGQYIGPIDELRDLIAPLIAAAEPATTEVRTLRFWDAQRLIATNETPPHSWGDISRYSNAHLPDDVTAAWIDHLVECPSRTAEANGSLWSLGWIGGKVGEKGRTDTAYVHRDMTTLLRPTIDWPVGADDSVARDLEDWANEAIAIIAPHTPDESYQNFPNRLLPDPLEQYYAENLPRLIEVKGTYDPDDVFRNPQSIPTS